MACLPFPRAGISSFSIRSYQTSITYKTLIATYGFRMELASDDSSPANRISSKNARASEDSKNFERTSISALQQQHLIVLDSEWENDWIACFPLLFLILFVVHDYYNSKESQKRLAAISNGWAMAEWSTRSEDCDATLIM